MLKNTFDRSEKEEFLDNYFLARLRDLMARIGTPELKNREDHVEYILDSLMGIADEYQAVMVENEREYWDSIETWNDEFEQRIAVDWVNEQINNEKQVD